MTRGRPLRDRLGESLRFRAGCPIRHSRCRYTDENPLATMDVCHEHNLNRLPEAAKPFGIRVSLRPGDSFARVLGADWEMYHWYATEAERDRALEDMASEHLYSRRGDRPTLRFERVEQRRAK